MGVPPWELAVRPVGWMNAALAAKAEEGKARKTVQRRQSKGMGLIDRVRGRKR